MFLGEVIYLFKSIPGGINVQLFCLFVILKHKLLRSGALVIIWSEFSIKVKYISY